MNPGFRVTNKTDLLDGRRVLVVEDEIIVAFNLECEIADAGGTTVGPAYTVSEAMDLLVEPIDVAVLDINLGREKVWPVAEELHRRGIPFLFASANCREVGVRLPHIPEVICLDKPVTTRSLILTLRRLAVEGSEAHGESAAERGPRHPS